MQLLRLKQSILPFSLSMSRYFEVLSTYGLVKYLCYCTIKRPDKLENIIVYDKPVSDNCNAENTNAIIYEIRHYS